MKICHVISFFSTEHGGPVVSLRNYAMAQATLGHQVKVYTLEGYPNTSPAIRLPAEIPQYVAKVGNPSALGRSSDLKREILRSEPADVYHLHGIWHRAMYYGYLKAKQEKKPYLIEINGALDPFDLASKPWRKRLVRSWFQDKMIHEAACIHVNSIREADHLRALGFKAPIVVIPAGFHQTEFFDLQRQSQRITPAWAAKLAGRRVFLYLSRIHAAKGIDDLLAAWAKLAPKYSNWVLLIVGPGDPGEIESRQEFCRTAGIEAQCVWTNMIPNIERAWAYTNADFFVLPSHKENFGNAVQEALGYGIPVLTTRETPWLELEQWQCGWVCDDNIASLTSTLPKALETPVEKLRQMGEAGKKIILDKFSLDYVAEQQIATYKWLGGGPPPTCLWPG